MTKGKLFDPKDFDKKTPKKNYIKWVVIAIIVIVAVIALIFGLKGCESDNQSPNTENPPVIGATVGEVSDSEDINIPRTDGSTPNAVEADKENQSPKDASEHVEQDVALDVEAEALKVIRGDYGNNPERKLNLGNKYQSIQNRVNELKRQGVF